MSRYHILMIAILPVVCMAPDAGEIIEVKAREVPGGIAAERTGKFFVGILP